MKKRITASEAAGCCISRRCLEQEGRPSRPGRPLLLSASWRRAGRAAGAATVAPVARALPARPAAAIAVVALAAIVRLLAPGAAGAAAANAGDYIVVVNAANPTASLAAAEVSKMFLQKTTRWRSGEKIEAVDLQEDSPARQSFSKAIHEKSTAAVKAYWQKMIFSGRDVPPPEKASAAEVLAFVRANPGGIGYVPAGTPLGEGVRQLKVVP